MPDNETREDGEIRFHYRREDRIGQKSEPKKETFLFRLFRINRSTMIILLDIFILTVLFLFFRPFLSRNGSSLETDNLKVELSGFLFDEKAYVSVKVLALADNPGEEMFVTVRIGEEGESLSKSAEVPAVKELSRVIRFELPTREGVRDVYAEILLPGDQSPKVLAAILRE